MDKDTLKDKILSIIETSKNGIKASTIAEKLKVDRHEVNSILYGKLKKVCSIDDDYKWHLISSADASLKKESTEKVFTQGDVVSWFKNGKLCFLFLKLFDYQKELVKNVVIDIRENLIGCKVLNEKLRFYVVKDELGLMFKTKNSDFVDFDESNYDIMKNNIYTCFEAKIDYSLKIDKSYQPVKFTEPKEPISNIDLAKLKKLSWNGKIKLDDVIKFFGNAIRDPSELDKISTYLEKYNIKILF